MVYAGEEKLRACTHVQYPTSSLAAALLPPLFAGIEHACLRYRGCSRQSRRQRLRCKDWTQVSKYAGQALAWHVACRGQKETPNPDFDWPKPALQHGAPCRLVPILEKHTTVQSARGAGSLRRSTYMHKGSAPPTWPARNADMRGRIELVKDAVLR